jgi:toxin ParE1/3/4
MTAKPLIPRTSAQRDVEDAIDHYLREAGERVALEFVDALDAAYGRVALNPGIGSPRYEHELRLPGLRAVAIGKFPYLAFYVEQADHVDVWRVLHAQRDVSAWIQEPAG